MVSAYFFGVSGLINAFTVAIQIPNLVRALVADAALSGAFVPVFSELLEKGERARAWRVASSIFFLLLLGLSAITAAFMLAAPWIMRPFGYDGAQEDLVVNLSRILFPTVLLLGLSGVIVGILNSYEHFTVPALSPIAWNLVIILAVVIGVPQTASTTTELYILAGGVLASRSASHDRLITGALSLSTLCALILALAIVPAWSVVALMAILGFGVGLAGPSRDLLVRRAATAGFGKAAFGRVYGFVYSGLDVGFAIAPLVFGPLMDRGHFTAVLGGVALLQALAIVSALSVGMQSRLGRSAVSGAS